MKRLTIIEGRRFDWQQAEREVDAEIKTHGEMTYRAAFMADPGILSCPFCDTMHWHEGTVVECAECGQRFNADWRAVARRATGRDPINYRSDNKTNANLVDILHEVYKRGEAGEPFALPPKCPPLIVGVAEMAAGIYEPPPPRDEDLDF